MKNSQTRENLALDKCRKFERQLRDCKEEILRLTQREGDAQSRKSTLEKQLESAELEISTLKVINHFQMGNKETFYLAFNC